ncbi:hypothetical protein ACQ4PT_062474 [Festuca glaucescens]
MTGTGDPVIGRDAEIDRVIDILCRRTKNCAALVGAAGVGKTAVAEDLAQRVASGRVPAALVGARVVEVDLGAMVASTTLRGMFEERIKSIVKEAEASNGKVILFIDEMHMLYSSDASDMLKPALARGRIRCVGATTFDEYRKYIEKDPALERRFHKVPVEEPTTEATVAILRGLKQRFQDHHGLEIQDAALVAAVHLGSRYITGRQFPDKAIDLIDEACTIIARKMAQIDNENITQSSLPDTLERNLEISSTNRVKKAAVNPNHVAQVQEFFSPELLNRMSEIVIFEPLSHEQLKEVAKIQIKNVVARVANKGISLSASDAVLDVILSESYNPMYGARPVRRWVQNNVMTTLSEMLVKGEVCEGSEIFIDATDDKKGLKYQVANTPVTERSSACDGTVLSMNCIGTR